jgi:hypothetical protein
MLRSPRLAALALAAPFVLAACGKDAGSTSSSTGAAPAPASAPTARATATATAPAPAATAAPAPASGGACSFAGTWTGNYPPGPYPFSGHPLDVTFNADGSGKTHSERADDEIAWKVDGGAFSLHRTKVDKGGRFTCRNEEVGKYAFSFTPDCSGLTFKLQQDPCKGRSKAMDGLAVKRK